jgi:CRP-like cAMP-binding protein
MVDIVALTDFGLGAFFVVLAAFLLVRYQQASRRLSESAELNHDLWRAMEDRLKRQDERIVDLMARLEVVQARYVSGPQPRVVIPRDIQPTQQVTYLQPPREQRSVVRVQPEADGTQKAIIKLLEGGAKSTIEVKTAMGLSREHTARMLKLLFNSGLVTRDDSAKPFVYQLTDKGRNFLSSA